MEARLRRDRLECEIGQNREELELKDKELQPVTEEINKRRQELKNEIDESLGLREEFTEEYHQLPLQQNKPIENKTAQKTSDESNERAAHRSDAHSVETPQPEKPKSHLSFNVSGVQFAAIRREMHGKLERIRIPIFSGNKMGFRRWNAAFTSCVDMTSLSPQRP